MTTTDPKFLAAFSLPRKIISIMSTRNPALHSPDLDVMSGDIENVIASIAGRYTDPSCPQLNYQDLVSEGHVKLVELMNKGLIDRLPRNQNPTRAEWFKFFKTVVNNHIRGLVHRHRGTLKRTGHRIPTKEQRADPLRESNKPIEISIDDPDSHLQLGDQADYEGTIDEKELIEHVRSTLTSLEKLVFDQLFQPNAEAWFWAVYRSFHGRRLDHIKVRIKELDQARGLGMELEQFLSLQTSIQQKFMIARDEKIDVKYNAALTTLCSIFNLQVPDSIKPDRDTVARMLTMISRRESDKVTDEVAGLLRLVGAKAPDKNAGSFEACFGVMFESGNRACNSCGVKDACRNESKTHGIDGTISYSPRLLGSKVVRTPVLVGNAVASAPLPISAPEVAVVQDEEPSETSKDRDRDDEIAAFLSETFVQRPSKDNVYLDYRESTGESARYIFWIERKRRLNLRFCNPSAPIRKSLVRVKNGFYLPDDISASEAIKLINRHAKERLLRK